MQGIASGEGARAEAHPAWYEAWAYLGEEFDPRWANGEDAKVMEEFGKYGSAEEFYAGTNVYIYQGLGYFLEGIKRPYYAKLFEATANKNITILDYGCGIGCDGILFMEAGYLVSFADVPSRSLEFCKWRVARRNHVARVYEIAPETRIPKHDVVWCMDVLEHFPSDAQLTLLGNLPEFGRAVFVNLVNDPKPDGGLHHRVEVEALTEWVKARWNCWHQDYYGGRVRLLVYGELAIK